MGLILNSKVVGSKVIFTICVDHEEALQLKGHVKNVYLFSEQTAQIKANLTARGKNSATKYFLIPRGLREDIKFPQKQILCQRIDSKEHAIFVYLVNKLV
ncbi:hypothetical protein KY342_03445 [Candidatus Woesearchaeota archaeon]|nr:hypothetical protein [Candidatus Woesearchaeota archaeon]